MDTKQSHKENVRRQYVASMTMSILSFCYGGVVGWLSPVLPSLRSPTNSPLGLPLDPADEALLASLLCLGAIFGVPIFGLIADRYGRKFAGLCSGIPLTICWILKLSATSLPPLYVARVLAGIGGAGAMLLAPLYASEVASPQCRGALSSMAVLSVNAGILFAFTVGAYTEYFKFIWIMGAVPVCYILIFSWMPETPVYLVKQGKYEKAIESIAWLYGVSESSIIVEENLKQVKRDQTLANQSSLHLATLKQILVYPVTLKSFAVCTTLVTFNGFIGMFAIMSYASLIFEAAGGFFSPQISSIILAALQLFGSIVSILLIERVGRKPLLSTSAAVVSLGMAGLGSYFYLKENGYDVSSLGWVPVISLSLAVMFFSVGVGPVPIIMFSEVFMVQVRGILMTFITIWMSVLSLTVSQLYGSAVSLVGSYGTFWGFAFIAILLIVYTVFFVPETKGKPLEHILRFFSKDFVYIEHDKNGNTENGALVASRS